MQDVLKDLAKMCDNQDGSRQVQALLDSATPQEVCLIPDTARPAAFSCSTNG